MRPTKTDDTRLTKSDRDGEIHINQRRIYTENMEMTRQRDETTRSCGRATLAPRQVHHVIPGLGQ